MSEPTAELERQLERSLTPADLSRQLDMVIANDRAFSDERTRRVVLAIAGAEEREQSSEVHAGRVCEVADMLRDWLRDDMAPLVVDAGTARLKSDWRLERIHARAAGRERERELTYDDSLPNGYQLLCLQLLGHSLSAVDWIQEAREQLASDRNGTTLEQLGLTLRAIRAAENGPGADPTGTGAAVLEVLDHLERISGEQLSSEDLAGRVHELSYLELASSRFVGGTSGSLIHSL
jgi:hypothetical protein